MTDPSINYTGHIVNRDYAITQGMKRYFTGVVCKHGHIDQRFVVNGCCLECKRVNRKPPTGKRRIHKKVKVKKKTVQKLTLIPGVGPAKPIKTSGAAKHPKNPEKLLAEKVGVVRYFTGKPCVNGHVVFRATSTGSCVKCSRDSQRRYRKSDKGKAYLKLYGYNYSKTPINRVKSHMRSSLMRVLKHTDRDITRDRSGYTPFDLIAHLEQQFTDGMTWDNHGKWHIDHIIPIKWYLDNGVYDVSIVNALSNLQPLWAADNLSKGSTVENNS